jgi:hypothetical protein
MSPTDRKNPADKAFTVGFLYQLEKVCFPKLPRLGGAPVFSLSENLA